MHSCPQTWSSGCALTSGGVGETFFFFFFCLRFLVSSLCSATRCVRLDTYSSVCDRRYARRLSFFWSISLRYPSSSSACEQQNVMVTKHADYWSVNKTARWLLPCEQQNIMPATILWTEKSQADHCPVNIKLSAENCPVNSKLSVEHCPVNSKLIVEHCPVNSKLSAEHCPVNSELSVEHCPLNSKLSAEHCPVKGKQVLSTVMWIAKHYTDCSPVNSKTANGMFLWLWKYSTYWEHQNKTLTMNSSAADIILLHFDTLFCQYRWYVFCLHFCDVLYCVLVQLLIELCASLYDSLSIGGNERTVGRTCSQNEEHQVGENNIRVDTQRWKTTKRKTQKEMERWHRGSRWQSMDENGPGSKCMAQVVEAICQQWHERLRWWWWWFCQ